jgi:hypothetical protein
MRVGRKNLKRLLKRTKLDYNDDLGRNFNHASSLGKESVQSQKSFEVNK